MDFKTFLEHFDTIAQAPNGIAKLRSLILDLAVRGKLVPQNPEDEPAEKLLKIIFNKHTILGKEFRKPQNLTPVDSVDKPFELPLGWCWCRFTDIGQLERGRSKHRPRNDPSLYRNGSIPLVQTGDVARANGVITTYTALYNQEGLAQSRLWAKGTLCITIAANIGDSAILDFDACFPDSIVGFLPTEPISDSRYFEFFMRTLKSHLEDFAPSTAQKNINLAILDEVLIPLPPLAEQKRIVEKVDELMALCDRFQTSQETRDNLRQNLRESAIASLMNAKTDEELQKSWSIVCDNWQTLSQKPEDVGDLRQIILQLAVQGKLTSLVSSKVILEELLNQFQAERFSLQLSEQDKKKILSEFDKTYKKLIENASYLTISARCICDFITKGTTPASNELLAEGKIPYIKVYNIVEQQLNFFYKPTYISREVHETKLKRSKVYPGDILMNIVGPPLGKVAIVPNDFSEWNLNQALAIFRPISSINKKFLYYVLSCQATLRTVLSETRGTAGQDNLSLEQCRDLQIPLFTLRDQERIVSKVDELMQMCDRLEENLRQSQQRVEALAASAISHLTV